MSELQEDASLEEATISRIGANILRLRDTSDAKRWIVRRLETVEFSDYARARRVIRLDVDVQELQENREASTQSGEVLLLPVLRLNRMSHLHVTFTDGAGELLPILNREDTLSYLAAGLRSLAGQLLGSQAPVEVTRNLQDVIEGRRPAAPHSPQWRGLSENPNFQTHLSNVSNYRYVILMVPVVGPHRRVIVGGYDEEHGETWYESSADSRADDRSRGPSRRWRARTFFVPSPGVRLEFDTGSIDECARFHFLVKAPYDLALADGCLKYRPARPRPEAIERRGADIHTFPDVTTEFSVAHAVAQVEEVVAESWFSARLLPVTSGMVRSAASTTTFIWLVLSLGAYYVWVTPAKHLHETDDPASATSLLLLAPAVLAAALAVPAQHSLTTKILFTTRLTVISSCVLMFVAAVSVALRMDKINLEWLWTSAGFLAGLLCARLLTQWTLLIRLRRKQPRHQRDEQAERSDG